jgi:hypothetical protein
LNLESLASLGAFLLTNRMTPFVDEVVRGAMPRHVRKQLSPVAMHECWEREKICFGD